MADGRGKGRLRACATMRALMAGLALMAGGPLAASPSDPAHPFFGAWCGIETRLWVWHDHIGFNTHTLCRPEQDPAGAQPPSFSTRVTCNNLFVEGEGRDMRLTEVPIPYITSVTLTLREADTLLLDLADGTAPDIYARCP